MRSLITGNGRSAERRASILATLAVAAAGGVPVLHLAAQAPNAVHEVGRTSHRYRALSIDDRVLQMDKSLQLSEEQRSKVKDILRQRVQQIEQARHSASGDGAAVVDRIRA